MYPAIRIGDQILCTCFPPIPPPVGPPIPCPNGSVIEGSLNTFIEDRAAARVGDSTSNCCGSTCFCPNYILTGSNKTFINNRPAVRIIDNVSCGRFLNGSIKTYIL